MAAPLTRSTRSTTSERGHDPPPEPARSPLLAPPALVRPGRGGVRRRQQRRHLGHRRHRSPSRRASPSPCGSATSRTSPTPRASSATSAGSSRTTSATTSPSRRARFNAGPEAVEALFAEALDITFIGPEPGHQRLRPVRRRGGPHRVRHHLGRRLPRRARRASTRPRTSTGTTLATPQLGNTQDVALRAWLKERGLRDRRRRRRRRVDPAAGQRRRAGRLHRRRHRRRLGARALGHPLHPGGRRPRARRRARPVARRRVRHHPPHRAHRVPRGAPRRREGVLEGLADAIDLIETTPTQAKALTNEGIEAITDKPLSPRGARRRLGEPRASPSTRSPPRSQKSAADAEDVGLLEPVDLDGIYDLTSSTRSSPKRGEPEVEGL